MNNNEIQAENKKPLTLRQKQIIYIVTSVLIIAIAAFAMVKLYISAQENRAAEKATAFLENLDAGNYQDAYNLMSDEQKKADNLEVFQFNNEMNRNSLGKISSRSVKTKSAKFSGKNLEITVTFNSQFQSDDVAEEVVAVNGNFFATKFQIGEYRTDSQKIIKY